VRWIKRQIAERPLQVLAVVLVAVAVGNWAVPDVDARDAHGRTPLIAAAYEGDLWQARMMLALGADIDAEEPCGTTALMRAIQRDHPEMAEWLLHRGADPTAADETGLSALHLAARKGERALAEQLVEGGADPRAEESVHGLTPIEEAEEAGHEELAAYLRSVEQGGKR